MSHRTVGNYAEQMKVDTYPWVLWIKISIRKGWFSYWWKTRGSNFMEIQLWIFKISIGMPWIKNVLRGKIRDYSNLNSAKTANDSNILGGGILIGKYK